MKTFEKSTKLNNVSYDVRGPVLEAATELEARGERILKLNIGNPAPFGFTCPPQVLEVMTKSLASSQGYSDSKGLEAAREAAAAYHRGKGIEGVTAGDIYTGNGLSELIVMCMQALCDSGDEVLLPAPDYPLWTAAVTLAGGRAVHYVCDESSDWMPDIEDMRRKITHRTKAIVIINPNNPTGALYDTDTLNAIAALARTHGLMLFSDEIYDRLVMDGQEHVSIAALAPDVFTVTLNGLSKSHLIAGYRCGWICISGDKARAKGYIEGLNMLSSMRLCSNVPAQHAIPAAMECLDSIKPMLEPGGRIYEQRETICKELSAIDGISFVKPKAAFYVFPRIDARRFGIVDDERFVMDFLKSKKVLLVHGGGFHWPSPDHFRIVYLPQQDVLRQSMTKLGEFLTDYHQTNIPQRPVLWA